MRTRRDKSRRRREAGYALVREAYMSNRVSDEVEEEEDTEEEEEEEEEDTEERLADAPACSYAMWSNAGPHSPTCG